jgi:hypothetical protein
MFVPNKEKAIVERSKVELYLLNLSHPEGRSKAVFFRSFGFSIDKVKELEKALIEHVNRNHFSEMIENDYGRKYIVEGKMISPGGRNPNIKTIWVTLNNEDIPKLVTAYPA